MTTFRQLSRPLRAAILMPWLVIVAAVALGSTPAFRQLVLDANAKPTADVSLTSPHWIGTIDPARLPASVVQLTGGNLVLSGAASFGNGNFAIAANGTLSGPNFQTDDGGNVSAVSYQGDGGLLTGVQATGLSEPTFGATFVTDGAGGWASSGIITSSAFIFPSGFGLEDDGNGGMMGPGGTQIDHDGDIYAPATVSANNVVATDRVTASHFTFDGYGTLFDDGGLQYTHVGSGITDYVALMTNNGQDIVVSGSVYTAEIYGTDAASFANGAFNVYSDGAFGNTNAAFDGNGNLTANYVTTDGIISSGFSFAGGGYLNFQEGNGLVWTDPDAVDHVLVAYP